jgi:hexokinase
MFISSVVYQIRKQYGKDIRVLNYGIIRLIMNLVKTSQSFSQTLTRSLTEKTSLPFIKHALSSHPLVKPGEEFQTMIIGGSICQSSRMKVNHAIYLLNHTINKQTSFITGNDLVSYIQQILDPAVSVVAINFAYPLEPVQRDGVLDGKLLSGSKENTFKGLIGKIIGETLEQHIKKTQNRTIRVSVANDTVCLLLSGLTAYPWNLLAGGVIGTGLNFALFLDEHTAVNLESANFSDFTQTPEGKQIDQTSASPGSALFEKEVSGAYLYKHFTILAKKNGIKTRIKETIKLDKLAQNDNERTALLARLVLTRSAELTACQIAGILEFKQRDMVFVMQGSLFWKGYRYKETVEKTVEKLTKFKAKFVKIENADLWGAARLVI